MTISGSGMSRVMLDYCYMNTFVSSVTVTVTVVLHWKPS